MNERTPDIIQFHRDLERLSRLQRLVWAWNMAKAGAHPYAKAQPSAGSAMPARALISRKL